MDGATIRKLLEALMPDWTSRIGLSLGAPFREFQPWTPYQEVVLLTGAATGSIDCGFVAAEDWPQSPRELIEALEPISAGGIVVMTPGEERFKRGELERAAASMGMQLEFWGAAARLGVEDRELRDQRLVVLRKGRRSGGRALSGFKIQICVLYPPDRRAARLRQWAQLIQRATLKGTLQIVTVENGPADVVDAAEARSLNSLDALQIIRHWRAAPEGRQLHSALSFTDADAVLLDLPPEVENEELFALYGQIVSGLRVEDAIAAAGQLIYSDARSGKRNRRRRSNFVLINRSLRDAMVLLGPQDGPLPDVLRTALKKGGARQTNTAVRALNQTGGN